jgi:hypothetical protein
VDSFESRVKKLNGIQNFLEGTESGGFVKFSKSRQRSAELFSLGKNTVFPQNRLPIDFTDLSDELVDLSPIFYQIPTIFLQPNITDFLSNSANFGQ